MTILKAPALQSPQAAAILAAIDSEQFSSAPKTSPALRARFTLLEIVRASRCRPVPLLRVTRHMPETPRMRRRDFLALLAAAAAWPRRVRAQQPGKTYRVGLRTNGPAVNPLDARRVALVSALAARGFAEGKNLVLVLRAAEAHPERLDGLMAELQAENVDVVVTFSYPAALAAKKATKDIPIVVTGAGDPVATGLVDGLARPGGNLTGVTELGTELSAKRLEILRDALPALSRVAMLWNAADLGMTLRYRSAEEAAVLVAGADEMIE